jgi:type III pantothenate kinase
VSMIERMIRRPWLVDLGHSRVKWARMESGTRFGSVRTGAIEEFLACAESAEERSVVLAAVAPEATVRSVIGTLDDAGVSSVRVSLSRSLLPVAPAYDTLGVDRWLAFNAAWRLAPGPLCVIDVGTAATVDVVDERGVHRGGWILPGLETSRAGLLARAPGLNGPSASSQPWSAPAVSTAQALERGLLLQQIGALRLAIEATAEALDCAPRVVLTGGGAAAVQSGLDVDGTQPDLVLLGLALAVKRMELER